LASATLFEAYQEGSKALAASWGMVNHIYHCTRTGMNVQVVMSEVTASDPTDRYEAITCPACARLHLVNKTTGKILGEREK
jgi:hypothetical protein